MIQFEETLLHDAAELAKDIVTHAELSLQRIAMVQVARNFWNTVWIERIKEEKRCYKPDYSRVEYYYFKDPHVQYDDFLKQLSDDCRKIRLPPPHQDRELPPSIRDKLLEVFEEMGRQISPSLSFFERIQWLDTGRINYKETWKRSFETQKVKDEFMNYYELCCSCEEDEIEEWFLEKCVDDSKDSILKKIHAFKEDSRHTRCLTNSDCHMMAYWHFRHEIKNGKSGNTTLDFISSYGNLVGHIEQDVSIDETTFSMCLALHRFAGIEYFWPRLDEKIKDKYFEKILRSFFCLGHDKVDNYRAMMDMRFLFLRKISSYRCSELLRCIHNRGIDEYVIISLILCSWKDFSFPPLEMLLKYYFVFNIDKKKHDYNYLHFVRKLCRVSKKESEVSSTRKKARRIMKEVLEISIETFKACWIRSRHMFKVDEGLIYEILRTEDISLIEMLINNGAMTDVRNDILDFIANCFSFNPNLFSNDFYKEFKNNVLLNEEERMDFHVIG